MEITVTLDDRKARDLIRRMPEAVERVVDRFLRRAALEVAREEARQAPKAFSTLATSIRADKAGPLHYRVAPGVNYGEPVATGRRPGSMPPPEALEPWVRRVLGKGPDEARFVAWSIARAIARRGLRPNSYPARTVQKMESRVIALVREGVDRAVADLGSLA